jgi:hypothetical protein
VLRPFLALGRFLSSPWRRQRNSGGLHEAQPARLPQIAGALPPLHPDLVSAVLAAAADFAALDRRPQAALEPPFWRASPLAAAVKDERKMLEAVRGTLRKQLQPSTAHWWPAQAAHVSRTSCGRNV